MKLVALLSLGVLVIAANAALIPTVHAEARTPAEATQHAIDELQNAIAQGRITLTPTPSSPTSTPSPTTVPTSTTTPAPTSTSEPSPTPQPTLPVPDADAAPLAGYVRPSTISDPDVLELALPQGRWDVRLVPGNCQDLIGTWTDVLLMAGEHGPALADRAYFTDQRQWGPCSIAQGSWHADAPCATDDDGTCEAIADPVLIVALGDPEPMPAPTVIPTPLPQPQRQAASIQAAAPAPIRQVVVQTVVVVVTPVPTDTPTSTPATATAAPTANPSPTARPSMTVAVAAIVTPAVLVIQGEPTPTATVEFDERQASPIVNGANRGWLFALVIGGAVAAAGVAWLTRGRRRYVL